jgi:hypothetical protein
VVLSPFRFCCLGVGGGALLRFLEIAFPGSEVCGVDNSFPVLATSHQCFDLPLPLLTQTTASSFSSSLASSAQPQADPAASISVHCFDGLEFLTQCHVQSRSFDCLFIDTDDCNASVSESILFSAPHHSMLQEGQFPE